MTHARKLTLSRLRKFRPGDVFTLAKIFYLTAAVSILQRTSSIPKLVDFFDTRNPGSSQSPEKMDRVVWLTDSILWFLFSEAFCVKKSLILFHYGRKFGMPISINFGVLKKADDLKGHAWVEVDGVPFGEEEESSAPFNVIYRRPKLMDQPHQTGD